MKKITIGIVIGVLIAIGGSVWAVGIITAPDQTGKINTITINTGEPAIVGATEAIEVLKAKPVETAPAQITAEETRFRSLEARVSALEAKQK